jgi:multimeric flavodoxin WrbA
MKVLLVNGSPHPKGCTFTALSEVGERLKENGVDSEIFQLGTRPVRGCIDCKKCKKTGSGYCAFDDDVCNKLIDAIDDADGIVVGSPVYYSGPNGALCAVLDRAFYSAGGKFQHMPSACVVSCRRGGASASFDRLNKYFAINRMPIATSQYWNSVHGFTPDDVRQDLEGLQIMRTLADNLSWLLKSIENESLPEVEDELRTNFID